MYLDMALGRSQRLDVTMVQKASSHCHLSSDLPLSTAHELVCFSFSPIFHHIFAHHNHAYQVGLWVPSQNTGFLRCVLTGLWISQYLLKCSLLFISDLLIWITSHCLLLCCLQKVRPNFHYTYVRIQGIETTSI